MLSELGATVAPLRDWAGSITAEYWLQPYTKKCVRKGDGKKFRLKNTFADVDGITRLDEKTSALSLGEALRINLEDLIPAGALSSHGYSFRRGDARISTSQRDRLQYIDTLLGALRHFDAAGVTLPDPKSKNAFLRSSEA